MDAHFTFWAVVALLLFAAEALLPGAFLLWFGFAAAALALVLLAVPGIAPVWQVVVFAVFSLISVGVYLRWFRKRERASDAPLLNRRAEQLVGSIATLDVAISGGRGGRVKIGDAFWSVEGADLPVGSSVRVVAVDGMNLKVQAA